MTWRISTGAPSNLCKYTATCQHLCIAHILTYMCVWRWRATTNARRLAARRSAARMSRRHFDLKVELSLVDLSLAFIHLDLRQTPPRHSNLRFPASPATRMPPTRRTNNYNDVKSSTAQLLPLDMMRNLPEGQVWSIIIPKVRQNSCSAEGACSCAA